MTTAEIDGMTVEVIDPTEADRRVTVIPPEPVGLAAAVGPKGMIGLASDMATALKDIVERQHLYAVINGRKFPQVEAWMTIARMDNVVAREVGVARHEDGSYEATVELLRLSDGMVIGRASALCGTPDDPPWGGSPARGNREAVPPRSEPARRSMAVTRATSRAFRQQYSWIMALAGYEPTPAEEMPRDREEAPVDRRPDTDGIIGIVAVQGTQDAQLRETPDGWGLPFRVKEGRQSVIVIAHDQFAKDLASVPEFVGSRVRVWGTFTDETYDKGDHRIGYKVLHLTRIVGDGWTFPAAPAAEDDEQASLEALLA